MTARTYWVGLPVGVTIHDDGTVTYEVDTSEASQEIRELDTPLVSPATLAAEAALVDAYHEGTAQ